MSRINSQIQCELVCVISILHRYYWEKVQQKPIFSHRHQHVSAVTLQAKNTVDATHLSVGLYSVTLHKVCGLYLVLLLLFVLKVILIFS